MTLAEIIVIILLFLTLLLAIYLAFRFIKARRLTFYKIISLGCYLLLLELVATIILSFIYRTITVLIFFAIIGMLLSLARNSSFKHLKIVGTVGIKLINNAIYGILHPRVVIAGVYHYLLDNTRQKEKR